MTSKRLPRILEKQMRKHSKRGRKAIQRFVSSSGSTWCSDEVLAADPDLRAEVPQGVKAQRDKDVSCSCGWSGRVRDLSPVFPRNSFLVKGPGFPVCPSCKKDEELQ